MQDIEFEKMNQDELFTEHSGNNEITTNENSEDIKGGGVVREICPVTLKERYPVLDILRGLAIFGILLVNAHDFAFSGGTRNTLYFSDYFPTLINKIVVLGSDFIARGKFIAMFSFLFGVGMAVLAERIQAKGMSFPKFYTKRLLILLIIGIIHGCVIWDGDVLMTYAMFGFILMLFYKASTKTLVIWGLSIKVIFLVIAISGFLFVINVQFKDILSDPVKIENKYNELMEQSKNRVDKQTELFQKGSLYDIHIERIATAVNRQKGSINYGWDILAMFLFGVWAWKKKLFQEVKTNRKLLVKMCRTGFITGLIANIYVVFCKLYAGVELPELFFTGYIAEYIGAFFFCMFYVSGTVLLVQKPFFFRLLKPFSFVGRSALSNYILDSIIFTLIFYSYGLGYFGKTAPVFVFILAVFSFTLQIVVSKWWLSHYRFGPLEWIWRSLTYRKTQRMKAITQ